MLIVALQSNPLKSLFLCSPTFILKETRAIDAVFTKLPTPNSVRSRFAAAQGRIKISVGIS